MADSNSARHVEAHISVLYLGKQPRNPGSYSQGVAGTVKQGICTVCCRSCVSMDGSLALLNDAAISFAH